MLLLLLLCSRACNCRCIKAIKFEQCVLACVQSLLLRARSCVLLWNLFSLSRCSSARSRFLLFINVNTLLSLIKLNVRKSAQVECLPSSQAEFRQHAVIWIRYKSAQNKVSQKQRQREHSHASHGMSTSFNFDFVKNLRTAKFSCTDSAHCRSRLHPG
jgi:hypothetical protein